MASKTHIRRVKAAKRASRKRLISEGRNPDNHADWMASWSELHERVTGKKLPYPADK